MVCTEQENISWTESLVNNFPILAELVVHLFSGMFDTAKVCLEFPQHCGFAGCKVYGVCFPANTEALAQTCASQVLNERYDIFGKCEVVARAR